MPRIVRAFAAGQQVWINRGDMIGMFRDITAEHPDLAALTETLIGGLLNTPPSWVDADDDPGMFLAKLSEG